MRANKARYYSELADEVIAADGSENTQKMYSLIKKLSGIGPTSTDILKTKVDTVSPKKKKKSNLGESFPELAASHRPTARPLSCVSSDPPSYDEILLALHKLKNNKAGGIDGLPLELFRRGAPTVCQPLQELISLIWLHRQITDDWNIAVIILCYKKGNKAKCSNYRGISLIVIAMKVLEAVIKNRLEPAQRVSNLRVIL